MLREWYRQLFEGLYKWGFLSYKKFTFIALEVKSCSFHAFWCFVTEKELKEKHWWKFLNLFIYLGSFVSNLNSVILKKNVLWFEMTHFVSSMPLKFEHKLANLFQLPIL